MTSKSEFQMVMHKNNNPVLKPEYFRIISGLFIMMKTPIQNNNLCLLKLSF